MKPKQAAVVLIAHGSRLEAANEEVRRLAARLAERLGQTVIPAFLELASPSIPEGIDQALSGNPSEIKVLPYFLTQGRHVQEDIPRLLADKARAYPETPIRLLPYLGAEEAIIDCLAETARKM
ncbi:cobalamin biosynthesis protein CbiX [Deltaproteobacteria bacterium PRO3]|nr:cobalamin biosynthesis protein CbiX [Deltaproteobacteria bacterium PRO3]